MRNTARCSAPEYLAAPRAEKGHLLNGVVAVGGLDRKAPIRLLRRASRGPRALREAGRPRLYGPAVAQAAGVLWEAAGQTPHIVRDAGPAGATRLV